MEQLATKKRLEMARILNSVLEGEGFGDMINTIFSSSINTGSGTQAVAQLRELFKENGVEITEKIREIIEELVGMFMSSAPQGGTNYG